MFSFFKRKKTEAAQGAQLVVPNKTAYEPKLPTVSDERITASINELMDGKYTYVQLLLENFFFVNEKQQKAIAQALLQTLGSLSAKKWYTFSDICRGSDYCSHSQYLMFRGTQQADLTREKYPHLSDEEYIALLCIGTFNRNGYFREDCLRKLAKYDGLLRYFYIRVNDWVQEIRNCSAELLKQILPKCPLYDIIRDTIIFEKLAMTHRRSEKHIGELYETICTRIKNELGTSHLARLYREEPMIRNAFYRFGCQNGLFSKEILENIIEYEPFGSSKELILMHKIGNFGCSDSEYEKYISHKCPNIRYTALLKKYEELNSAWDGLDRLLTDKSSKVRALAVFILKKYRGFKPREYFLELLGTENTAIAVAELGTYGTKADAEALKSFICPDNTATARKALRSYGKLMGADGAPVYWEQLCSDNSLMATEAYRTITANRINYSCSDIWNEYKHHTAPTIKKHFIHLLCRQTDWDRMKYLVELYADDSLDETLKSCVIGSLSRRNMYKKLTGDTADELVSAINEHRDKLGKLADGLLFDISKAKS